MRTKLLAVALGVGVLAFLGTGRASAQHYAGYGNGGHDLAPHGHQTYTPFGSMSYYGNGFHDLRQHGHSVSPFGGVNSYGYTPFGPTTSYNGFPGGYGAGYGGGYGGGYASPFGYGYGGGYIPW